MRRFLLLLISLLGISFRTDAAGPPNVILILADDLGYGDLGCYGAKGYATPHIDRLAAEGVRFTDFYVSSAVCSASRAALMTGCYHERVGVRGALGPNAKRGLAPEEQTIAEILKAKGYATGMAGKWHLGDRPGLLPVSQGFDEYLGLPYSNDMWPEHPDTKAFPKLPMIEGERVVDAEVTAEDQHQLTTRYTERAVQFIRRNRERPFFFYLAHSMCHVPLFESGKFAGKSARGLFGDVLQEMDWSTGEIMKCLAECGLTENTLVIFTSDNGPWLSYGDHAGSAGPLREGKGTSYEGGVREPMIARWPGKIPAGSTCKTPAMNIDILPTLAALTGASLPDRRIDGRDITPLFTGQAGAQSPHEAYFFYYASNELQAMRSGPWKLIFPHTTRTMNGQQPGKGGIPGRYKPLKTGLELYHLDDDIGESRNLAAEKPEIVSRLQKQADVMRSDLGDSLTKAKGSHVRGGG
ncbi:MAG: sulfatase [Verrucomicrobiales bacterium]|nr:sulfatase [Verrucomicrobiales bacterium]